jgi:hypothetical protein
MPGKGGLGGYGRHLKNEHQQKDGDEVHEALSSLQYQRDRAGRDDCHHPLHVHELF